jgi:hypothetical protein
LYEGTGEGFFYGYPVDDPDHLWPDAWCAACERARREGGDARYRRIAGPDSRLRVCDRCYETVRERAWPHEEAFDRLVEEATEYLEARQSELETVYRLSSIERYDWNQDSGQLVLSQGGTPQVVAEIQFVGSHSSSTGSWLWSWGNRSLVEGVKSRMREVRRVGEEHGFLKLAAAHWPATPQEAWEMTAVAARLLGAKGAYRSPDERGALFMVMTEVRWAQ